MSNKIAAGAGSRGAAEKGMGGGAGLGLAIVSTGIKMCGGTCGVQSEPGKGSKFWIELPVYND